MFDFLVRRRPVSHQTKSRRNLQAWKDFVRAEAAKVWPAATAPMAGESLRFTIVYLCDEAPADIDNIIKPIQDALVGLAYVDDNLISDVDSHRRALAAGIAIENLPVLLQDGVIAAQECIYVRVGRTMALEDFL